MSSARFGESVEITTRITPRHLETNTPADCTWYHSMALPGIGEVAGIWDLRSTIDVYLGEQVFQDKRCLDVGTASGYLAFEMERRQAADVVAVDVSGVEDLDFVPFATGADLATRKLAAADVLLRIQRSFWLAHRALRSRVSVHYGSIYALPDALGQFDIVMMGMVLPHLRDPLRALENAAQHCSDTLLITQQAPRIDEAYAYFLPQAGVALDRVWWSISDACLERMLGILGFEVTARQRAEHACPGRTDGNRALAEWCTTTVAKRTVPPR
ncbi:MAG TPA: class I SAM-dependent methyltransferase [Chloroflexota bacterium]|nr:class I SAM-dependent methyltransferase [Chloroflexota bacterium]